MFCTVVEAEGGHEDKRAVEDKPAENERVFEIEPPVEEDFGEEEPELNPVEEEPALDMGPPVEKEPELKIGTPVEEEPAESESDDQTKELAEAREVALPVISFLVKQAEPREEDSSIKARRKLPPSQIDCLPNLIFARKYQAKAVSLEQAAKAKARLADHQCNREARQFPSRVGRNARASNCAGSVATMMDIPVTLVGDDVLWDHCRVCSTEKRRSEAGDFYTLEGPDEEEDAVMEAQDKHTAGIGKRGGHGGLKLTTCVVALDHPVAAPLWYAGTRLEEGDHGGDYAIRGFDARDKCWVVLDGKEARNAASLTNHVAEWPMFLTQVKEWLDEANLPWAAEEGEWKKWVPENSLKPRSFRINQRFLGQLEGLWECNSELAWSYGVSYWASYFFSLDESEEEIEQLLRVQTDELYDWKIPKTDYYFNNTARKLWVSEAVAFFDSTRGEYLHQLMDEQHQLSLVGRVSSRGTALRRKRKQMKMDPLPMDADHFPALFNRNAIIFQAGYSLNVVEPLPEEPLPEEPLPEEPLPEEVQPEEKRLPSRESKAPSFLDAVVLRPKFFVGKGLRNPRRVSKSEFIFAQEIELFKFDKFAREKQWKELHDLHFDWWMFPVEESRQPQFNVWELDVEELKQDDTFMANYRQGVRMVAYAWGWDVWKAKFNNVPGAHWTNWDIRLAKMIRSAWLFGEKELMESLQTFAWTVHPNGGLMFNGVVLDEVYLMA